MQHNFTLNLKKQSKTANKKSPAIVRGMCITNKIFNMAKLLQKLFSCKRKAKKVQDTELQVINGYLCYHRKRYSELDEDEKEAYRDFFITPSAKENFKRLCNSMEKICNINF